jgi:surfactin synthase thioesterase subunit
MPTIDRSPVTLVCLPFGGAGASFYRPWSRRVGQQLTILPLQLPGRERLVDREPYREVSLATDHLLAELCEQITGPARVAVFGHSLGAVLGYELARRLVAEKTERVLVHLFVSGSPEPASQRTERATGLSDDEFIRQVSRFAGYKHEALEDPEMRELILPTLRADVEMHENYRPSSTVPLPVPITSIRGTEDRLVSADDAAAWTKLTSLAFAYTEVPGGHMYLADDAEALLRLIVATVGQE